MFHQRLVVAAAAIVVATISFAQGGPPPAKVQTAPVSDGVITPTTIFKGSVAFKEVSEVAAEVAGKVDRVAFEEGMRLSKGDVMVELDAALLKADIAAARAVLAQYQAEQEQEQERLRRTQTLLEEDVSTPQEFDDVRFTVAALGERVRGQQAEINRLETELEKKTIRAPFDGIVLDRMAELGAWRGAGASIGTLALTDMFDIIAFVPETDLGFIAEGQTVEVTVAGRMFEAPIAPSPPRGNVNTRTFPIKLRVTDQAWLKDGMSADVRLPVGEEAQCVMVPRDAVLLDRGDNVVYLVRDGQAVRVRADVLGYRGMQAGIAPDGIKVGEPVVVKGQERLRDGQPVEVMQGGE